MIYKFIGVKILHIKNQLLLHTVIAGTKQSLRREVGFAGYMPLLPLCIV